MLVFKGNLVYGISTLVVLSNFSMAMHKSIMQIFSMYLVCIFCSFDPIMLTHNFSQPTLILLDLQTYEISHSTL
jgi:hypothetical protein